ncbi:hypothetical protein [Streptomyces sp. NPDC085540]|uniref:hypothetical protein n=1 Tax=Streptomyces sp. NPDC085540 TaxID=3365730 RepID=UPI0037D17CBC
MEISLAAALLMPQKVPWALLPTGVLFRLGTAVVMGPWSFAFAMWAGLLLLLAPYGHDPRLLRIRRRRSRHAEPEPTVSGKPLDEPVHA